MINILWIEDNDGDYVLGLRMIKDLEHKCNRASTLATASDLIKSNKYDVIIADLHLDDSDDNSTIQFLHENVFDTPIIIISGYDKHGLDKKIAENGCYFFLRKDELVGDLLKRSILFAVTYYGDEKEKRIRRSTNLLKEAERLINKAQLDKSNEKKKET